MTSDNNRQDVTRLNCFLDINYILLDGQCGGNNSVQLHYMPTYLSSLDTMSFISLFLDSINSPLTALNGLSTLFHFNFKLIYIVYTIFKFQQSYSTLWYSIMKTFAMTLGELNYEDTFIPSDKLNYPTAMNVLFLLFCLGMPIILMNMLVSN